MEAGRMDVEHSLSFVHYVKNILTGEKYTVYFVQQVEIKSFREHGIRRKGEEKLFEFKGSM